MEPVHVKSVNKSQNVLLVSSWKISLNCLLISISGNDTWTDLEEGWWNGKTSFYFLFFFVNRFVCFVQCFTIIIIKCKASFSCHSSSSHYSTQGFVLISFHFIFSFLKNKILYNFTCDLLLSLQLSDLKCRYVEKIWQKTEWIIERKHFHSLITPSCFNKQKKCRYERTLKERNHLT